MEWFQRASSVLLDIAQVAIYLQESSHCFIFWPTHSMLDFLYSQQLNEREVFDYSKQIKIGKKTRQLFQGLTGFRVRQIQV